MEEIHYRLFTESNGICTDTRKITEGCLFICIKGDNFDGNTFAQKALDLGAGHVIVDNSEFHSNAERQTLVDNSIEFLQELANHHRKQFSIPVLGITGSNGKTSTKELMNAVLSKKYNVLATEGNLNNHLGVPFTLLRLTSEHEIAIIEMGANRFKDIEELSAIAEPTHGIITNIGKAHLEGFGGFEGVLKTKRELYEAIDKVNGTIIVNQDDPVLLGALPEGVKTFNYGTQNATVIGQLEKLTPFVNMSWSYNGFNSGVIGSQLIGKYNFYNFLAAASFGVFFDVPNELISEAISSYTPTNNRSQVKESGSNTLIMDCYNANPTSMSSAIESFAAIEHAKKLMILGDMKELGTETEIEHKNILTLSQEKNLEFWTVGSCFGEVNHSNHFNSTQDVQEFLKQSPQKDALILLKGSRSIGLEKLEEYL